MNTFVIFQYPENGIQWTAGDTHGVDGEPELSEPSRPLLFTTINKGHVNIFDSNSIGAIAGFNFNDGGTTEFETLPNSGTDDITLLTTTSNVGNPGVWMFEVDELVIGGS